MDWTSISQNKELKKLHQYFIYMPAKTIIGDGHDKKWREHFSVLLINSLKRKLQHERNISKLDENTAHDASKGIFSNLFV